MSGVADAERALAHKRLLESAERKRQRGEVLTDDERAAVLEGDGRMTVQTANALVTGAPISAPQLHAARHHFKALAALASVSGPRFANANRDAVSLHDAAVRRLRADKNEEEARMRRYREHMDGLIELGGIE